MAPKKLTQATLYEYIQPSSSPPPPSSYKSSRKRRAKSPSPPGENKLDGGSDSDLGAIRLQPRTRKSRSEEDDEESPNHEEEVDESPRRRTASRFKRRVSSASDDSDVQIIESSKSKRRLIRRSDSPEEERETSPVATKRRRLVQKQDRDDEDDDDNDSLMDELDEHRIIEPRLRARDKKSKFQKNLEKLKKRKKRGQAENAESSSYASSEQEEEGDLSSDESGITPAATFEGAKPDNDDDNDSQLVEDSFIVEDEGTEAIPQLPAAFSMNSYQDLTHHFKIICQLFVHLAVRLPREREAFMRQVISSEDGYFYTSLSAARRNLSGLRDSLVASSIWRTGFKRSLERYPEFELFNLEISLPVCDACHLGGRVSTKLGRVSGLAYNRISFEPLYDSDDSDSDEEVDDNKKIKKEFHLGRFCARRTRVFHQFSHWEHTLYQVLCGEVEELRETGTTGFVKVAHAHGIKPPEDQNDADGITDWLDERGIIDREWQRLRDMMNSARGLDAASKRGEDQDD